MGNNRLLLYDTNYHMTLWLTEIIKIFLQSILQATAMFLLFPFHSPVHSIQLLKKKKLLCSLFLPDHSLVSEISRRKKENSSDVTKTYILYFKIIWEFIQFNSNEILDQEFDRV